MRTDEAFSNWICGFVDGEGCFHIQCNKKKKHVNITFSIKLRQDDYEILTKIKDYFKCGKMLYRKNKISKPSVIYKIGKISELQEIIVPFFLRHLLRAKKKEDFKIWKEAVGILYQTQKNPYVKTQNGGQTKWKKGCREKIDELSNRLREQREFRPPYLTLVEPLDAQQLEYVKKMLMKEQHTLPCIDVKKVSLITGLCRQAIEKQAQAGKVIKVSVGKRRNLYPLWQFDKKIFSGLGWALKQLERKH